MSDLSDYLTEVARERDIAGPRPFGRAAGVSFSQAQRLLAGSTTPTRETLERIAGNLGLSYAKLCRLAELPPEYDPFTLPRELDRLSPRQRRVVLSVAWALLEAADGEDTAVGQSREAEADSSNGALPADLSQQRVTETVWEPTKDPSHIPHTE